MVWHGMNVIGGYTLKIKIKTQITMPNWWEHMLSMDNMTKNR